MYKDSIEWKIQPQRHKTVLEKGAKDQRCKLGPIKGAVNDDYSHTSQTISA